METKICRKCKEERDICLFGKTKQNKDGLKSYCNECRKIESKKYRNENSEKRKETLKKFYENNKEKELLRFKKLHCLLRPVVEPYSLPRSPIKFNSLLYFSG